MQHHLLPFCAAALAAFLPAQYDQERSTPTDNAVLVGATVAQIDALVQQGLRPIDLEVQTASPLAVNAVFVRNSGVYNQGFWHYYGITSAQLTSYLTQNQARLIELEPYDDGNGNTRFCCVMVSNTGSNARNWGWLYNTSVATISNTISGNGHRIFDFDEYTINGTTYYSCLTIANTGSDQRSWWWYTNVTTTQIGTYTAQNQARLSDLERRSNGNFNVVMQRDSSPPTWHWFVGITSSQIYPLLDNYAQRPVCIDSYIDTLTLQRRYIVLGIQNENDLTAGICEMMHARTNGTMGAYLKQVNGSEYAGFNQNWQFEPASTMKTLAHVHAMRRVHLGLESLGTMIPVATGMNGSCPTGTNVTNQSLQTALQLMMENSDNARTKAVVDYFTLAAINTRASQLGMTNTSWNHTIGCPTALTSPNQLTLYDIGLLHEEVANGYLGSWRETFYDLMDEGLGDFGLDTVIDQEAASIGGFSAATIANFKSLCALAHKRGGYGWTQGSTTWFERADGGWIRIPFVVGGAVVDRDFVYGAFVNDAAVEADAIAAIYDIAIPEMLRPRLRAALLTWSNSLATTTSYGSGCGSPTPMSHTTTGVPRVNSTTSYQVANAFPSTVAVLAFGFSNTTANGLSLPASLVPFGGEPGCFARASIDSSTVHIANASGAASRNFTIPNVLSLVGLTYYTQWYSLGPTSLRSSNGVRSEVGL